MSGGSYDYAFKRLEELANELRARAPRSSCPALRLALANRLDLISAAARDIEWVDSGDYAPGDEVKAIQAALLPSDELAAALESARAALRELNVAIERSESLLPSPLAPEVRA